MVRTGLRKLLSSRLLPLALMAMGIGLSGTLSDVLQQRAQLAWKEQATRETALQTATLQGWLESTLTTLSGLALLVDNSPRLDADTFARASEGVPGHSGNGLVTQKALLEAQSGRWQTRHFAPPSSGSNLLPGVGQPVNDVLAGTLQIARQSPGNWFMSAPFADTLGEQHVFLVLVPKRQPGTALAAVLDLQRAVNDLMGAGSLAGTDLQVSLEVAGSDQPHVVRGLRALPADKSDPGDKAEVFESNT